MCTRADPDSDSGTLFEPIVYTSVFVTRVTVVSKLVTQGHRGVGRTWIYLTAAFGAETSASPYILAAVGSEMHHIYCCLWQQRQQHIWRSTLLLSAAVGQR